MKRLMLSVVVLIGSVVSAQTVYRCGPEGRVYSQIPCLQGRAVDVSDSRSDAQRTAAQSVAHADALRAERLAQERRAEAQRPGPKAVHINARSASVVAAPKAQAVRKTKRHAGSQPDADFRAVAPPSQKTRPKKNPASSG